MKNFNETIDNVFENFGIHKTVVRERYPSKLKLSDEFVESFKREFQSQSKAIYTEDNDGNQVLSREERDPKKVLKEFQKALKFLI
jgi:tRNA(Met) C34 N-acetyltransferase TmcA